MNAATSGRPTSLRGWGETLRRPELFLLRLSGLLLRARHVAAADALLRWALARYPVSVPLLQRRGECCQRLGRYEESAAHYRAALDRADLPQRGEIAVALAALSEGAFQFDEARRYWDMAATDGTATTHGQACQALLRDPAATNESLLAAHQEWARRWTAPAGLAAGSATRSGAARNGRRPLRVGFTSSFWGAATIANQFLCWAQHLDRRQFELVFYVGDPAIPAGLAAVATRVRPTPFRRMDDDRFLELARRDRLDVLVELNGFSPGHRFGALARRAAPVQVSYLNHTATCGVPNVDWVVADATAVPVADDAWYTERVYRLPRCFFCFNFEPEAMPVSREPPQRKNGFTTFGFFGSPGKLNLAFLDLIAAVLRAAPASRLLMANHGLSSATNRARLAGKLGERGIEPARVELLPGRDRRGIAELHGRVDITLDSWPYCGGNTLAESLWYGVPAVTLKGARFSGRYGASLLEASGLEDLVATTPGQYADLAARLSADTARLMELRAGLRTTMCRPGGLADTRGFAAAMATAFREMCSASNSSASRPDRRASQEWLADRCSS